ncbi:hypothetical protein S245_015623, partial [Arachis hypogaea]
THLGATLLTASVAHRHHSVAHLVALPHRTHFACTSFVAVTLVAARFFELRFRSLLPPSSCHCFCQAYLSFADEIKNARRIGTFKQFVVGRSSE